MLHETREDKINWLKGLDINLREYTIAGVSPRTKEPIKIKKEEFTLMDDIKINSNVEDVYIYAINTLSEKEVSIIKEYLEGYLNQDILENVNDEEMIGINKAIEICNKEKITIQQNIYLSHIMLEQLAWIWCRTGFGTYSLGCDDIEYIIKLVGEDLTKLYVKLIGEDYYKIMEVIEL